MWWSYTVRGRTVMVTSMKGVAIGLLHEFG